MTRFGEAAASVQRASGGHALGAGFIAFCVVLVLAVACFFLFRSMSRHLRKVPSSFEPRQPPADPDPK